MPDYTGNLNLAKPIPNEDSADIRVINENMDKIDFWSTEINKKTKGATSEVAGIVKFGTDVSTALEGSKLAEVLGIEYGGVLNNTTAKVAGKGYYDTANKKIYKCTVNTSINYADAGYFVEVSNNDLLGKLENLFEYKDKAQNLNTGISGLSVIKRNGVVSVSYSGPHTGGPSNLIYTLPIGFRPYLTHRISIFPTGTSNTNMMISSDGGVVIDCMTGGPTHVFGSYSFLATE